MKNFTLVLMFILVCLQSTKGNSSTISRVVEFKPAPGQYVNRLFPTAAYSNTADSALLFANNCLIGNKSMVSLGAFGGYVVVAFDHSIVNVAGQYDFKALGNAFANSAEPGIVSVCQDLNKNGIPDPEEPWYELAGSDYNRSTTIHHYQITYYRPNPDKQKSNVAWKDNQGNSGTITHISYASQATIYPLWMPDSVSFSGTKLAGNVTLNGSIYTFAALDWGYADNWANSSDNEKIGFDLDWAVDASGNAVHLDYVDFVKVHTGMLQQAGWSGETSTEVAGIEDLHPDAQISSGINATQSHSLTIVNNRVTNSLIVEVPKSTYVTVLSATGRVMLSKQLTEGSNDIDCSSLSQGVYLIKSENEVIKFIKQ